MTIVHLGQILWESEDVRVREIGIDDLRIALSQGWDDFADKRGDLVFVGFIYPLAVLFSIFYALHVSILPLLFPLISGSVLLGPALASGFYELARRREDRLDTRWRHFFDAVRGPAALSLFGLTAIVFLIFLVWILAAWIIYANTLGALGSDSVRSAANFLEAVFTTPEGRRMFVVGNLVGLCFATLTLAISVVSFPMLVDRPVGIATAIKTSIRVARKNPTTVAVWGLIVVGLLVLGSLPALVGLAVVLPVLGYATWHLYRRAVVG